MFNGRNRGTEEMSSEMMEFEDSQDFRPTMTVPGTVEGAFQALFTFEELEIRLEDFLTSESNLIIFSLFLKSSALTVSFFN